MPWKIEKITNDTITEIYTYEDDNIDDKVLVYKIDKLLREITFYPKDDFFIGQVTLKGFSKIPDEFAESGYIKGGIQYYIDKKFKTSNIKKFIIEKNGNNTFRSYNGGFKVELSYESLKEFKTKIGVIVNESKRDKSELADEFFHNTYPRKYTATTNSSRNSLSKVIKNLDKGIIEHLTPEDVVRFEEFYEQLIEKKYTSLSAKFKLITRTKLKIDKIAVQELVEEFEKKLKASTSESNWGKFLKKYLFLVDSKYLDAITELNLVLAGARNVDFGLIDIYNYLDIFEIKKPTTKLLASNTDRGNYYFHTDSIKAITQAEKYLYNAERKGTSLTEDIEREIGKKVNVIKPRAILLMGHSNQLDNKKKQTDFRIIRNSLKNIEIVLYDELLERLKNQRNKTFE